MSALAALSHDQLRQSAPAIFAERPSVKMSDRYQFIPTLDVIKYLGDKDIVPVQASQVRARTAENSIVSKHLMRFAHQATLADTSAKNRVELVMVNSHNGMSTYQFSLGVFRLVCSNGLVVKSADFGEAKIRHTGDAKDEVYHIADSFMDMIANVSGRISVMENKILTNSQALQLASAASKIRWPLHNTPVNPSLLLQSRRPEDAANDLWTVFNVVQENLVRGGMSGQSFSNPAKSRKVRALRNIDMVYNVNKALWEAAEGYLN